MDRGSAARLSAIALAALAACSSTPKPDCIGPTPTVCYGACTNLRSDNQNCGVCGNACPAGNACVAGSCVASCQPGTVACNGMCVDPLTDPNYCGASGACRGTTAGAACPAGEVCSNGTCALSCQAGLVNCNGRCTDPALDPTYCGASGSCTGASVGTACLPGFVCAGGACALSCQAGLVDCAGTCVDPKTDPNFCGASSNCSGATAGTACPSGTVCAGGACALSCQAGLVNCNGTCVDPLTDRGYCGASGACSATATPSTAGTACPSGEVCSAGTCALSCQAGEVDCNGQCVDPMTDPIHCGASGGCTAATAGTPCPSGEVCSAGTCALSCQAGLVNCNGKCIDPTRDPTYCGASGACSATATPSTAGATCPAGEVCSNGTCALSCQAGLVDCNGTCVNPLTDPAYCGASGTCSSAVSPPTSGLVCASGNVCSGGGCLLSCQAGLTNCSGTCVDMLTDAANCSACGVACAPGFACTAGQCTLYCKPGLVNCNGTCVDPRTDPTYCGASGTCSSTATPATSGTACGPSATCYDGACYPLCAPPQPGQTSLVYCAGSCVNPLTSQTFCGASGYCTGTSAGTTCLPGQTCSSGTCLANCTWSPPVAPVSPPVAPFLTPWPAYPFTTLAPYVAYVSDGLPAAAAQLIGQPGGGVVSGLVQEADLNLAFLTHGFDLSTSPLTTSSIFAIDAQLFVPAGLAYDDSASIVVQTTEQSPAPADGSAVTALCPIATGGLRVELDFPRSNGAPTVALYDQSTCPATAIAPTATINPIPAPLVGGWHDLRIEGAGSTCHYRVLVDNTEIERWTVPATTCANLTGTHFAIASGPTSTAGAPALVTWSNVSQFLGVGKTSPADCVP